MNLLHYSVGGCFNFVHTTLQFQGSRSQNRLIKPSDRCPTTNADARSHNQRGKDIRPKDWTLQQYDSFRDVGSYLTPTGGIKKLLRCHSEHPPTGINDSGSL